MRLNCLMNWHVNCIRNRQPMSFNLITFWLSLDYRQNTIHILYYEYYLQRRIWSQTFCSYRSSQTDSVAVSGGHVVLSAPCWSVGTSWLPADTLPPSCHSPAGWTNTQHRSISTQLLHICHSKGLSSLSF